MFLTYTGMRNLAGNLTSNSTSANLTLMDTLINSKLGEIYGIKSWYFLYKNVTASTVASTQFYNLPYDVSQLLYVTITIGTTTYTPRRASSRRMWDSINTTTNVTSNIPEWYYVFNDQVGFYPTLSSSGNTINIYYKIRVRDTSVADYTTGTIVTATDGDETIVGDSTSWTTGMENKCLRITDGNAASLGDGIWYEIASITDGTNLEFKREYGGTSISGGSASYIMGDMFLIPEA